MKWHPGTRRPIVKDLIRSLFTKAPGSAGDPIDSDDSTQLINERVHRRQTLIGYLVLIACQIKLFWNFWNGKDLPLGDAAQYYYGTCLQIMQGTYDLVWSPLYKFYYSLFIRFVNDLYVASLAHRFVIIVLCSFLVFEVMRRLLTPFWGLIVALWWLLLSVNHDPLYEVHSFSLLIVLFSWLVLSWRDSPWCRSGAIAILTLAAVLVRNELVLILIPFALTAVVSEWRRIRRPNGEARTLRPLLTAYAIPNLLSLLVILFFFSHADRPFTSVLEHARRKQSFNFGQIYSFVYGNSNSEWGKKNPWTNYEQLVKEKFGTTDVTLVSAFFKNPRAMAQHVTTNLKMSISSVQISLLGSRGLTVNPDYSRRHYRPVFSWGASILLALLMIRGVRSIIRKDSPFPKEGVRLWILVMLACALFHGMFVGLLVVPRPAFIYPMNLVLMAFVVAGARAYFENRPRLNQKAIFTMLIILWCVFPSPWRNQNGRTWNKDAVYALRPYEEQLIASRERAVLASYQPDCVLIYVTRNNRLPSGSLFQILQQLPEESSLSENLMNEDVRWLYLDCRVMDEPVVQKFVEESASRGWSLLSSNEPGKSEWRLYRYTSQQSAQAAVNVQSTRRE